MPERTKCPYCSSPLLHFVQFCPNCGRRLPKIEEQAYSKDLYHVLQVDPSAEPEVIDAAYKRLAAKYHPDVNKSSDAVERMQDINTAHGILANPVSRQEYDNLRGSPRAASQRSEDVDPNRDVQASGAAGHRGTSPVAPDAGTNTQRGAAVNAASASQPSGGSPPVDNASTEGSPSESSEHAPRHGFPWIWAVPLCLLIGGLLLIAIVQPGGSGGAGPSTYGSVALWTPGPVSGPLPVFDTDYNRTLEVLSRGDTPVLLDLVSEEIQPSLTEPGLQRYTVVLRDQTQVFLNEGWCAKDRATLESNMRHYSFSIVVNGHDLPHGQIHAMEYQVAKGEDVDFPEGLACNMYGVLASEWPEGENRVLEVYQFDADIFDGYDTYKAGAYVLEYAVRVPTLATTATAPATPSPSGPSASNCYMTSDENHSVRTNEFGTKQAAYLNADMANIRPDTRVRVDWYALNVTGISSLEPVRTAAYSGADLKVDSRGNGTVFFSLSASGKGFPWGKYRAELWLEGTKICEELFAVK